MEPLAESMGEGAGSEISPALPAPFYRDSGIVIYHGDCRRILPSLPSESVDFTCTDAPYGVAYRGRFDRKHAPIAGAWYL